MKQLKYSVADTTQFFGKVLSSARASSIAIAKRGIVGKIPGGFIKYDLRHHFRQTTKCQGVKRKVQVLYYPHRHVCDATIELVGVQPYSAVSCGMHMVDRYIHIFNARASTWNAMLELIRSKDES